MQNPQNELDESQVEFLLDSMSPYQRYQLSEFMRRGMSLEDLLREDQRHSKYIPWAPYEKQQSLIDCDLLELFFGGAVGGSKSVALLMDALQYVHETGYSALLIRKTLPDLKQPGGLMDLAQQWLANTDAKFKSQDNKWVFPSGAVLQFGYMETANDKYRYQGGQYQYIGIDEAPQILLENILWLKTRLRKPEDLDVPIKLRMTGNPGCEFHEQYQARYIPDEVDYSSVKPLLKEIYEDMGQSVTVGFLPSRLEDNAALDKDGQYRARLELLDSVTREQLLNGDWDITASGAYFQPEDFKTVESDSVPTIKSWIRAWDLAWTGISEYDRKKGKVADWTAGVLIGQDELGNIYIRDVRRFQGDAGEVEKAIMDCARSDPEGTRVAIERAGASGPFIDQLSRKYREDFNRFPLYQVKVHAKSGDKAERLSSFTAKAKNGQVFLCAAGNWQGGFKSEALRFTNEKTNTDDQLDAVSVAMNVLARTKGKVISANEPLKVDSHAYYQRWIEKIKKRDAKTASANARRRY
jgi:predicted phage terminase large subunit-like protein